MYNSQIWCVLYVFFFFSSFSWNLAIFPSKIDKEHYFLDKLTYIYTWYWHILKLNSIPFNFCSYPFFRLKPRYWVLFNFSWNLDHFPPKIDKEHHFFGKLTYIHTQYWHFMSLKSISNNFCYKKNPLYQFLSKKWSKFQQNFNKTL